MGLTSLAMRDNTNSQNFPPDRLLGSIARCCTAGGAPNARILAGIQPVYAALLTPKGKFLHDAFFYRHPDKSDAVLMEVDRTSINSVTAWLTRYKLRRSVELKDVSQLYCVWAHFGSDLQSSGPVWPADPRLPALGYRTVLPAGQAPAVQNAVHSDELMYQEWRYAHGVAEGDTEIPTEKAAPLEYNLDTLHGVSYSKGCYIGQERNSYTHFRGILRRRLMPVRLEQSAEGLEEATVAGDEVVVQGTGESAGVIRGVAHEYAIAHLKLSAALRAEAGEVKLSIKSNGAAVRPVRPSWWPPDWGFEEARGMQQQQQQQ